MVLRSKGPGKSTVQRKEYVEDSTDVESWEPGRQILQQDLWGRRLITSRPVTVVNDASNYLALYSHPNAPYRSNTIRDRYSKPVIERIDIFNKASKEPLEERVSRDYHVLTLNPPNSWHSVWLFWTAEWQVKIWYVNLQFPIRRTSRGILVQDCALDIAVEPDMSWSWKDEDEFVELTNRGFFTDQQISSVRDEADRMIEAISNNASPFSDGWEKWRPNPRWPVPQLPEDWDVLAAQPQEQPGPFLG